MIEIEIRCHRCKTENVITYIDSSSLLTAYMEGSTINSEPVISDQ